MEKLWSIFQVPLGFPCVFSRRVTFPLDKVHVSTSLTFVGGDCFHLMLMFSFDKVQRRSAEVHSM